MRRPDYGRPFILSRVFSPKPPHLSPPSANEKFPLKTSPTPMILRIRNSRHVLSAPLSKFSCSYFVVKFKVQNAGGLRSFEALQREVVWGDRWGWGWAGEEWVCCFAPQDIPQVGPFPLHRPLCVKLPVSGVPEGPCRLLRPPSPPRLRPSPRAVSVTRWAAAGRRASRPFPPRDAGAPCRTRARRTERASERGRES